jgi:hypothetical protein
VNQSEFFKRELLRLDLLIQLEVARERSSSAPEQNRESVLQHVARMRSSSYRGLDANAPWSVLLEVFELTSEEADIVLIGIAPELDSKYAALYACLNNDAGQRQPTRGLAFRLLHLYSDDVRWRALGPWSRLIRTGILNAAENETSLRSAGFTLNPVIAAFLLGAAGPLEPAPSAAWLDLDLDGQSIRSLRALVPQLRAHLGKAPSFVILEGQPGSARLSAAAAICAELGIPMTVLDLARTKTPVEAIALDNRLRRSAVYVKDGIGPEDVFTPDAANLLRLLESGASPVFLPVPFESHWQPMLRGCLYFHQRFDAAPVSLRRRIWQQETAALNLDAPPALIDALAGRFAFTPGQIRTAARTLEGAPSTPEVFFAAARRQSVHALARFARRLPLDRDWGDLILPPATMRHLRELAGAIEHRHTVQTGWGMRLGEGGINVMFAGTSGTGKSLAAGVIARHLGLDCYKVSIPGIVSKYIGETERNLERLFQAARQSNAILFFDEADALFGKRSEVKDSHDRYANLEVAYLLQKMEEHDGVVMLATNMMANMDDAFSRRLQFVVEFPPPTEPYRERLWRLMFPPGVPLDASVDFRFLARQFELTGGQIRTASLDAAFLAAQDGGQVTMSVLIRAVARQFAKQHRVPSPSEFQNYFPVLLERGVRQ